MSLFTYYYLTKLNTRSAGRELAFLALSQLTKSTELSPDKLILAATRTLRDVTKAQVKQVQKDLKELGEFFFNQTLNLEDSKSKLNIPKIHENVGKLELAAFALKEALDLPEFLNQPPEAFNYAVNLINLYRSNKEEVNNLIANILESAKGSKSKGWTIERTLTVDRDLLRIATTELLYEKDCPPVVVIDEALELSKKYGTDDSPKFVNGVLADVLEKLAV
jgi:transcription antitermination protein NusB